MKDDNGEKISLGDILTSEYGYKVLVCEGKSGFYGSLICEIEHSCRNIPYALNGGKGFKKIKL